MRSPWEAPARELSGFSTTIGMRVAVDEGAMSAQTLRMASLASEYCELIEASSSADGAWLRRIADLLPRLHAAVKSLDMRADEGEREFVPDLDARFELFSHLRDLLGEKDAYWLEYDRIDGDGHPLMTGSLADDLTDIYCELKNGLRILDGDPALARIGWCRGYRHHWGQHLVDAERHLYALESGGRLD